MNHSRLYSNLCVQWELLQAIPMPTSPERDRRIRIGCLLLVLEGLRQAGRWRNSCSHLVEEYDA